MMYSHYWSNKQEEINSLQMQLNGAEIGHQGERRNQEH